MARDHQPRRLQLTAGAVALAIALQAGAAIGGATIASLDGPEIVSTAAAITMGPPQCYVPTIREQKDNFAWAGSGTYRLHGWLYSDTAYVPGQCLYRQWHYGEDSRNCDGCALKTVTTQTVRGKYWVCGNLNYDSTLTQWNVAQTFLTPGVWENYVSGLQECAKQASLTGHQDKAGVFSYDYYLSY